jgi:hypothetical protein
MNRKSNAPVDNPYSACNLSIVAPPSPMVPITQVMRSETPAWFQMRRATSALAADSSTETTRAEGAAAAIRSAPYPQ